MSEKTAVTAETKKARRKSAKGVKTAAKAAKGAARKATAEKIEGTVFTIPGFENLASEVRERFEAGAQRMRETFGNFAGAREGATEALEAVREAAGRAGRGWRDVNLQAIEYAKKDVSAFFDMMKDVFEADTVREAFEIQGSFVREQLQRQMKQARELGQMTADATRDAFKPVTETVTEVVEKIRKAA